MTTAAGSPGGTWRPHPEGCAAPSDADAQAQRAGAGGTPAAGSLHVDSVGDGPPVVLLHGWAMHSGLWGTLVPQLARRHRVHAVDLPGHGRSAVPPSFDLDGIVDALNAALPRAGPPFCVIGWSLGGLVAMRWSLRAPERIRRVVLVATSPRFVAGEDWPHAMARETLDRFGDELQVAWKLTVQRFLALQVHGSEHGRATLAALRGQLFARGEPAPLALSGGLELIREADLRDEVSRIGQPALVVSGGRDTLAPPEAGRWLAGRLPDARFVAVSGAGHAPFLSHADAFGAALEGFLDGGSTVA